MTVPRFERSPARRPGAWRCIAALLTALALLVLAVLLARLIDGKTLRVLGITLLVAGSFGIGLGLLGVRKEKISRHR